MKRILPFAVVLLTLTSPVAALALAGGPTLTAQSSASSVAVNGTFTVTVQMNTKTYQAIASELHLTYPADKLQVVTIVPGTLLPKKLGDTTTGFGTVAMSVGVESTATQGTGPIAVVTLKALAVGSAQVGFAANTQVAAISPAGNVVDTMTPVTITITGAGTTTATPTPSNGALATAAPSTYYTYTPVPGSYTTATPKPTGIGAVSKVKTGPGETTILALIVGSIITLLYVGYTGSDAFRRNEAVSYSKESKKKTPNFRS